MTITATPPSTTPSAPKRTNPVARFLGVRVRLWPMLILIAALITAAVFGAMNAPTVNWLVTLTSQSRDSQVITSVTRVNEHVLVRLRAEGKEKQQDGNYWLSVEIRGTSRTTFLRYSFNAKLGIEGDAVAVTPQDGSDHAYLVSVPRFRIHRLRRLGIGGLQQRRTVYCAGRPPRSMSWACRTASSPRQPRSTSTTTSSCSANRRSRY